jgi:curved DNA-binding protein CbpA
LIASADLWRQQERGRQAFRDLARQVITDGYRLAAKRLHPDRGDGSTEEMARLNRVRDFLKQAIARA